jgi:hypothetical protein
MIGHGAKFNRQMEQAIVALLSHRNVDEAARAVGVNANTLLRWMKEPEFETAYREARRLAFSQAIGRFQDASGAAATTVLKIMVDPNVPARTRLQAAQIVLEQGAKTSEIEDIEGRVARLERMADAAMKSLKHSKDANLFNATPLPGPSTTQAQIAASPIANTETDEDVVE